MAFVYACACVYMCVTCVHVRVHVRTCVRTLLMVGEGMLGGQRTDLGNCFSPTIMVPETKLRWSWYSFYLADHRWLSQGFLYRPS